jgi:hypothetical protein
MVNDEKIKGREREKGNVKGLCGAAFIINIIGILSSGGIKFRKRHREIT